MYNCASKWKVLGKLHRIQNKNCEIIQEFMNKIPDVKSEIEDMKITMYEAIKIRVLNSVEFFFARFFGILSHKTREKWKLLTFKSFVKF